MSVAPQIAGLVYVQPLGQGGYADVYLYEQQSPRMPVAVKVLKGTGITDAVTAEFLAEADTMAALGDHPYIVQVFRAGTADDGRPYLVMKYYPPPNLAQRSRAERFPVGDVLRMGIQLASAVETAHQASIVHRDIKPANVLISAYGAPGLTDFGIAGRGLRSQAQTAIHGVSAREEMGVSVPWSAPEVVYGESNGDARADVYSLAATLWQMLTGRSPFEVPGQDNTAYALMPRIRSMRVPPTGRPDVPASLERVLAQAMAKDPAHRPPTALDLARALQAVEQEQRLPRTQILVLDDRGRAGPHRPGIVPRTAPAPRGSGSGGSSRTRPAEEAEDLTRVKGPQRVQAQTPDPAEAHTATRLRPTTVHPTAPASPHRPAATSPPGTDGGSTPPVATGPARGQLTGDTRQRPAAQEDDARLGSAREYDPRSEREHGHPGSRGPWLTAAVLVGVLLVAGLTWLLVGDREPAAPARPVATVASTTDSSAIGEGVDVAPVVRAEGRAGLVHFTWSYDGAAPRDSFRVQVGVTAEEAGAASPAVVTGRSFDVPTAPGGRACAVVSVVRAGAISPPSLAGCATAS